MVVGVRVARLLSQGTSEGSSLAAPFLVHGVQNSGSGKDTKAGQDSHDIEARDL